jgi:hypothetical protein
MGAAFLDDERRNEPQERPAMMTRLPLAVALVALLGTGAAAAAQPTSTDAARALTASATIPQDRTANIQAQNAEMNKGKDHQDAVDATCGAHDGEDLAAQGRRHADAMNRGADHERARDAASRG